MTAPADCSFCCPAGWSPNIDQVPDEDCPTHGRQEEAATVDYMPPICPDCREHDDGSTTCDPSLNLCPLYEADPGTAHVVPVGDLIAHGFDDCPCGPATEPVKRDDGSMGWVVVHHSLDGREAAS